MTDNPFQPAVWFPSVRCGSGSDVFTERLCVALQNRGLSADIAWLPHRAEYAPWTVKIPAPPRWANIVHINSWLHERFMPYRLPIVTTVHGCVHDLALVPYKSRFQQLYHRFWIKRVERRSIERASQVTAVSRYTADQVKRIFAHEDIVHIPNWINTHTLAVKKSDLPHSPFRLLFVGKICRLKGADLLPPLMKLLGPEFVLHYTGRPEDFKSSAPLPNNMIAMERFKGEAAMATIYESCDALLFPTRLEGFGLVALEAQAFGRPVVTTNCSSLPEVVLGGQTGVLCPVDDVDALAKAARKLRDDPALWIRMSEAATVHARIEFSESKAIDRYLEIYSGLILQ